MDGADRAVILRVGKQQPGTHHVRSRAARGGRTVGFDPTGPGGDDAITYLQRAGKTASRLVRRA
jgi:hypothetical protein